MMSHGAAEASFHLLQRFSLLEILLPLHVNGAPINIPSYVLVDSKT